METPEAIREAYAAPPDETPEQRRRRLASKRAAKHRYFARADAQRREQSRDRQRRWRETLDADRLAAIREQNRLRQQARRVKMTSDDKKRRNEQQRRRRAGLADDKLQDLREREKLRMRRRRRRHGQSEDDESAATTDDALPRPATVRLSSSPVMLSVFGGSTGVPALPPAAALGMRNNEEPPAPTPRPFQHHPPIEIAPLQFVLPPASSIQSQSFADRTLAPLPQVQNVLPHASTLLQPLVPLALTTHSATSVGASSPFVYAPPPTLGSLLHPSIPASHGVLPSLSQLPELLATSSRDFFDSTPASGYFPSIADFTSDFETTFRT